MSKHNHQWKRTSGMLGVGCLLAAMAWLGPGCSSSSGNGSTGGSSGQSSAGRTSSSGQSSGGQTSSSGQGGSSTSAGGGSSVSTGGSKGGQSTGSSDNTGSIGGSGSRCCSTGGTGGGATGGSTSSGGGKGGTGGTATGGIATGGSSQGGQDGGAGSSGTSPSPDAGVDRASDTSPTVPDGGSAAFCPSDGTACKIMAMGDSITDGVGSSGGGYRFPLFKLTLTDNKKATFVGRNINGPASFTFNGQSVNFPQGHEGYSGWTIKDGGGRSGIYNKVDGAMQTNMPHIITLMIGTNDVNINLDLANAPNRLGELLDKIIQDAPKALIVVAKLVPTTNDGTNGRVRTYNSGIEPIVQARISQGKNLKMVDMYAAFTANTSYKTALMNDELHPKDAGYSVMAQTWYDAIKSYLH